LVGPKGHALKPIPSGAVTPMWARFCCCWEADGLSRVVEGVTTAAACTPDTSLERDLENRVNQHEHNANLSFIWDDFTII
jgi:hypothetical protein